MLYYITAIAALTLVFWALHKLKVFPFCPICAGTVLIWASGLIGLYFRTDWANPTAIAILMGASLGALAEKHGSALGLFWKSSAVLLGFSAIYLVSQTDFLLSLGPIAVLLILTWASRKKTKNTTTGRDIYKDCC